jgi:hypothetical protein
MFKQYFLKLTPMLYDNKQVIDQLNHAIENQITACLVERKLEVNKRSRERVTIVRFEGKRLYREVYLDYGKRTDKRKQTLLFTADVNVSTTVQSDDSVVAKVNINIEKYTN